MTPSFLNFVNPFFVMGKFKNRHYNFRQAREPTIGTLLDNDLEKWRPATTHKKRGGTEKPNE